MDEHKKKVEAISARVRQLHAAGVPIRIYHGSTNSTRTLRFNKNEIVDISNLNQVLSVDLKRRTALVEPNIPMDLLVKKLGKYGLVPAVVPEFPGITIGGAIAGGSGESSSFRHGLVQTQALKCEVVLGSGEIVQASPTQRPDLFLGLGATCGSLGILTAIELALVPATKFVGLEYVPVRSFEEAVARMLEFSTDEADFVDCILFSKFKGIVMIGRRSDKPDRPIKKFRHAWNEWFYLHAEKMFNRGGGSETIPLVDYLSDMTAALFGWENTHSKGSEHPLTDLLDLS